MIRTEVNDMEKDKLQPVEWLIIGLMMLAGLLTIWRCFYSVDLTDESYIYGDALATIKGNLPYVHNFSEGSGQSMVTMVFLWIYMKMVPSLTGVVLYMRLCFAILRLLEVYGIYRLLRKKHERIPVLLGCSILTVWHYFSNYFSYNMNSTWLILLVSVILYVYFDANRDRNKYLILFVAGILSALGVFANPFYVLGVAEFVTLLLLFSPQKEKIKTALIYCAGGIVQGLVVLISLCVQAGFKKFLKGIKYMLIYSSQLSSVNRIKRIKRYFGAYWLMFLIMLLAFLVVYFIYKNRKLNAGVLATEVSLISGTIYIAVISRMCLDIWTVGGYLGTVATVLGIALFIKYREKLLLFIGLPFISFTVLEIFCSKTAHVDVHTAFAIPTLVGIIVFCYERSGNQERKVGFVATFLIFASILISDVFYVYRDAPLWELNTKMPTGVYKGLFTTELNAECVPEVEAYIRENTSEDEYISFRDCVPFAYLMFEGKCCDIQTWDSLEYTLGWNNDHSMYNYFKAREHIPDKVIYIDFGRDKKLSIEDDDWLFNRFIESYYDCVCEEQMNEMFRFMIFEYEGTFDGDFSCWTID